MKSIFPLLLFSLIFTVSCNLKIKDTSNDPASLLARFLIRRSLFSTINTELPSNLSVTVPRSIRKGTSGSASTRGFTRDLADDVIASGITGLNILQDATDTVSQILQESKRDLILVSGVYATAKASPGTCIKGGTAFVDIGEEAANEMLNGLKTLGLSDDEAQIELQSLQVRGILPSQGQSIPSPAIVYRTPTDTKYDHEISLSFATSLTTPENCPTNSSESNFQKTIRWNDSKTRIFSSVQKNLNIFSTSITISGSITYITEAGKKDKAILNIEQKSKVGRGAETTSKLKFSMEECAGETSNNTNNCTTLNLTVTEENGAGAIKTSIKGRTDNLGGYTKTDYVDGATDYSLEECFGTNNDLIWLSITSGGIPYTEGTRDSTFIAGYDTDNGSFDFESTVNVSVSGGTISDGDFIVLASGDPTNSEDLILGVGEKSGSDLNLIFYGSSEDISGLKVYKVDYSNGEISYIEVSGATVITI